MKKSLLIVPMVLLIAGGCSNDSTEVVEKKPVVDAIEQEKNTEDSTVVEKENPKEKVPVEAEKDKPKENTDTKKEPEEIAPVTGSGTEGEPMDDISDEVMIFPNEKLGYITNIEKTNDGSQLTVDFAKMIIDDSHEVGFYIENNEVGKDKVIVKGNVQAFSLNGNKLNVSTVEELANRKGRLFKFLYTDAGELFMIEEKYLP